MLLVLAAINFTIFVFLIRRFVARPLGDYLVGRRKEVVEALAAAAREKAEAEKVKADYEAKAAGLEDLRHSMIEEMRGIAKADRKRGLVEARQAAERIAADAERTAVSDVEMAKRELRREAARLAAKLATERIRADLDEDKKDKLFAEFIAGVER
jgi:F-type H+-transporting ATPase subunit b